jgi:hypothetical protein
MASRLAARTQDAESGVAFVLCQGCGEFTPFDPHNLRGTLGEAIPLCACCRGQSAVRSHRRNRQRLI